MAALSYRSLVMYWRAVFNHLTSAYYDSFIPQQSPFASIGDITYLCWAPPYYEKQQCIIPNIVCPSLLAQALFTLDLLKLPPLESNPIELE